MSKWGLIDGNGNTIIPFVFDFLRSPRHGMLLFRRARGEKLGYMNLQQHRVIEQQFDWAESFDQASGLARVSKNTNQRDMYGLINQSGEAVLPNEHDGIGELRCGLVRCAVVKDKTKYVGFKDLKNTWRIDPGFQSATSFRCGFSIVSTFEGNGNVAIDGFGRARLGPFLSIGEFFDGTARVVDSKKDEVVFVTTKGEVLFRPKDNLDVRDFHNGRALTRQLSNQKVGYVDLTGAWIVEPKYDEASPFFDHAFAVVESNKLKGLVDLVGREVVQPRFLHVSPPRCGLLQVESIDQKTGTHVVGFADLFGHVVIEPKFKSADYFSEGYAAVEKH